MSPSTVLFEVDDREPIDAFREEWSRHPELRIVIHRLSLGDFTIGGTLLVERKTAPDFAASIVSGRLFKQASRLASSGQPCMVILEGNHSDFSSTGVSREALQGAVISLCLSFRLPVLRSADPSETVRLSLFAAQQLRNQEPTEVGFIGRKPKNRRKAQLRVLSSLPRIGPTRANALLNQFGNLPTLFTASEEALAAVPGIGRKTAAQLRWVLEDSSVEVYHAC